MRPLKPVELAVLIALSEGPGHGYSLVQRMADESEGRLSILPGNLYAVLGRLQAASWVVEQQTAARPAGPQRREFAITAEGRERLAAETRALEHQTRLARARLGQASES